MALPLLRRIVHLFCLILVIGSTCATSTAQTNPEVKKVLLLFTHESHQPAQIILEDALRSTLVKRSPTALEIYSDYLDGSRTSVDSYESAQVELLQRKYGDKKFDLVVAINPPALSLVVKNRSALFSNAPIVFLLLEQRNLADLKLDSNVTGLWAESNYRANLDLALALQPGTKRVVVISGAGPWDNYFRSAVQEDFRPYEGKLQFDYLSGLTVSELQTTLSTLPAETVVSFVSSSQDRLGNTLGNLEVLRQICPVSNSPIYGSTDAQLGLGIVGGQLTSFEDLGEKGAELAIRILTGEKPDSIAPHGVKGVAMFDWRALQRWNIGEQNLPAGSTIRFKQLSFWELYKWRIAGLLGILLLQSLLIAILLIERNRRRRAKESLDKLNVELEQRIVQRTEALDAKSRELETFAYSVAHDLKAPLRGIDGYSRLLLEDHSEQLDAEGQTFLSTIQSSAEEMSQLIDDLLSYSRLERRDLKPELLPLKPLITKLVEHKKRELNDRDIDFVLVVNGGSVLADVNGLTQSLNNYLDNAIKFTQKSNRPRIEVGAKDIHHKCVLWVKDNGIGFDPKFNERIFDIFQRLNQPEDYPGTGVGLAIVRKAMERIGGRAWAVGTPGEGATFYLEIPHQEGAIDKQFT